MLLLRQVLYLYADSFQLEKKIKSSNRVRTANIRTKKHVVLIQQLLFFFLNLLSFICNIHYEHLSETNTPNLSFEVRSMRYKNIQALS